MRIKCGGLTFMSDFDSGNLAKVEFVCSSSRPHVTEKTNGSSSSSPSGRNATDLPHRRSTQNCCRDQRREPKPSPKACKSDPLLRSSGLQSQSSPSPARLRKGTIQYPATKKKSKVLEFKIWTKPDCEGTPFENSFRSWFHFGVEGGPPGTVIKLHVMNLNRQGKLYFYGMRPVYKVVPSRESWKRIPGKVHYKNESDGNFVITFMHTLPMEAGSIIYFAFTYPFTYNDCQKMLDDIDRDIGSSLYISDSVVPPDDAIYFYRELLSYTLDGRRVDLLTITSCRGLTKEREERLPHLFPDHLRPRCHVFCGKKVIFMSSRVHPGETPSSFVFNGFLKQLLRPSDPKASRLRHLYVFKLIPMLNPDGVYRGHFRTDSRGVNLNRMYLIASPELHPSVYASRALLLYYHKIYSSSSSSSSGVPERNQDLLRFNKFGCDRVSFSPETKQNVAMRDHNLVYSSTVHSDLIKVPLMKKIITPAYSMSSVKHSVELCDDFGGLNRHGSVAASVGLLNKGLSSSDVYLPIPSNCSMPVRSPLDYLLANLSGNFGSKSSFDTRSKSFTASNYSGSSNESPRGPVSPSRESQISVDLKDFKSSSELEASDADEDMSMSQEPELSTMLTSAAQVPYLHPDKSGIAYYFDLHGHACKRGCFIYGNYFPDVERKVECMLLAKLMSINCPYFDFSACNFSAENMCSGSKRDGQSKEGSGRVALHTFTGIIHSYTLECNYNTGPNSTIQGDELSSRHKMGKSSAVFTPEIFSKVGEALLVSILDATSHNPQSRVPHSSLGSLEGVRSWLRKYVVAVSKHRNNYLKKNVLSSAATGLNFREKVSGACSERKKKSSSQDQINLTHDSRLSRLTACTRKSAASPPLSNEQFLLNFGMKYKRLHASGSSPDALRSPQSRCIDSLKKLLNPKGSSISSTKTCSHSRSAASSSLKPVTRKCKGSSGTKSSKYNVTSKGSSLQSTPESSKKGKPESCKRQESPVMSQEVKKPFVLPIDATKISSRSKKKGVVPSLKSSLPAKALLENSGNLRVKKKMQI